MVDFRGQFLKIIEVMWVHQRRTPKSIRFFWYHAPTHPTSSCVAGTMCENLRWGAWAAAFEGPLTTMWWISPPAESNNLGGRQQLRTDQCRRGTIICMYKLTIKIYDCRMLSVKIKPNVHFQEAITCHGMDCWDLNDKFGDLQGWPTPNQQAPQPYGPFVLICDREMR